MNQRFLLLGTMVMAATATTATTAAEQSEAASSPYDSVVIDVGKTTREHNKFVEEHGAGAEAVFNFMEKKNLMSTVYAVFPRNRMDTFVIRDFIPAKWLQMSAKERAAFTDQAQPGEHFTFQAGFFAMRQDCLSVTARLSELTNEAGDVIPAGNTFCVNTDGVDHEGKPFNRTVHVPKGKLQVLWMAVKVPETAKGAYKGKLEIAPENAPSTTIDVTLNVAGAVLADGGVSRDRAMSRLHWLNSTVGLDDQVTRGFEPIKVSRGFGANFGWPSATTELQILGRKIQLNKLGLPAAVSSAFTGANDKIGQVDKPVLAGACRFEVELADGRVLEFKPESFEITSRNDSRVEWTAHAQADEMSFTCHGVLEFDGFSEMKITVRAKKELKVKDVRFIVPMTEAMSKLYMGLNVVGGPTPDQYTWQWDGNQRGQEGCWLGGVNGGIRTRFFGEDSRPFLINVYYPAKPLRNPRCWSNFGRGGITLSHDGATRHIRAYSGARTFVPGEAELYGVEFLYTPFKKLDKANIYNDRYHHGSISQGMADNDALDIMKKSEANCGIFHHSNNSVNPWLNYPIRTENVEIAKKFFQSAHDNNLRMKIYYTVRELSMQSPEFPALLALNDEVIFPGAGADCRFVTNYSGPHTWLIYNLQNNFIPAWRDVIKTGRHKGAVDLTVIVSPRSRYDNFYAASLDYYVRQTKLDGLYIDDSCLDRVMFRRIRKILDAQRDRARIDIHSWNHFNKYAGFISCLYHYMPLMPYINQTWMGEGRDYDMSPEYLLVEATGIPYGVAGQMLGGNPWRGMLFNMTDRSGWGGRMQAKGMWRFWDSFGLADCDMIGFWDDANPVGVHNARLRATTYKGPGKAAIAVASWDNKKDISDTLSIDWKKLGLDPKKCTFSIPAIEADGEVYQKEQAFDPAAPLTIPKGKGFIITIKEK